MSTLQRIELVLYVAALLGATVHILLHKKDARGAALWLMGVYTVPALGLLLYLLFGVDRLSRRALRKELVNRAFRQEYAAFRPSLPTPLGSPFPDEDPPAPDLGFPGVVDRLCKRPLLQGNSIRLLLLGDSVYERMLEAIAAASRHIHLQTYIFLGDKVGRQLVEALARRAEEGLEVRLLYDPIGSVDALWFLDELQHTRIRVAAFNPLSPLRRRFQVNLRNHRKLLLVDGSQAYTGGMNVSEKHLVDHPELTRVKDYHFEVRGPVVHQMQEWFCEDWFYATGEKLISPWFFPPLEQEGGDEARVITSGPDGDYEAFYQVAIAAILGARRQVTVVTPYFIPDQGLLVALKLAARKDVKITLLVPGHTDHPVVTWAARTFYEELLQSGVRIFEREAPFLHAKALVVDDDWACVGSANMDVRSFRLNFEANLELRSPSLVRALRVAIDDDLRSARMINPAVFRQRSLARQVVERACALLNPLL